jgi:fused signal recognition particle receptor
MSVTLVLVVLAVLLVAAVSVVIVRRPRGGRGGTLPEGSAPADTRPRGAAPVVRAEGLGAKARALLGTGRLDEDVWERLHDVLLRADVGPSGAADLVSRIRTRFVQGTDPESLLRDQILAVLGPDEPLRLPAERLAVILVVGVNGSGKTTTIGKLAKHLSDAGRQVSVAASDTFRAAAGEQLEFWATRAGAHLVAQQRGADPGAVAFDAVTSATARGAGVLIVDTAGRLHTKQPLMDELSKIKRVIAKAGGVVDETLLVVDAQTGQNGIAQARAFTGAVDVTGVVLTKMDGTAKGGVVLAVREELDVPVRFTGVGEGLDDLRPFNADAFVGRLLS